MNQIRNRLRARLLIGTTLILLTLLIVLGVGAWFVFIRLVPLLLPGQPHTIASNSLSLQLRWHYEANDRIAFGPHASDGIVFIKTTQAILGLDTFSKSGVIALDAEKGTKLWEATFTGLLRDIGPIIFDDHVIFPIDSELTLRAVEKNTGRFLWEIGPLGRDDRIHALARDDQYVFVGSGVEPVRVFAVDPLAGKVVWSESGQFPARSLITVIYTGGKLYAIFTTGIYIMNSKTGQVVQFLKGNQAPFDQPTYLNGLLFLNAEEGIWAVDLDSARSRWSFLPACIKNSNENEGARRVARYFLYAPTPVGDAVYVTGGCYRIFALDISTGQERWEYSAGTIGTISPLEAIDGLGYVIFGDGSVRAIDLRNGVERGKLETAAASTHWEAKTQGLATWNSMLYIAFGDKTLYALGK